MVNNDGGGIFSLLPQAAGDDATTFERLFGTPHGLDIGRVASAYGVAHSLVSSTDELTSAVKRPPSGIHLVEARTERAANADLHRQLREAAAAAIR